MILDVAVLRHEPETGLGAFEPLLEAVDVEHHVVSTTEPLPDAERFNAAIVLGGSLAIDDALLQPTREWLRDAVRTGLPVLGIGLGAQLLAGALGASVTRGRPETGLHDVYLTDAAAVDPLFGGLRRRFPAFCWHAARFELPPGAVPLAGSLASTYQAFSHGAATYGIQFHPEVRSSDLAAWRNVRGHRALAERGGVDFDALAEDLRRAEPELDELAQQLLERWLHIVDAVTELELRLDPAA